MTRIDFYILSSAEQHTAWLYCCRLVQKAWQHGHQVFICCEDDASCQAVNDLLWTFRPDSFLPHSLASEAGKTTDTICIGTANQLGEHCDVLVNLCRETPPQFSRFKRLSEIVFQQPEWLNASRQRYSAYQQRGYPLHKHDVAA
ncbi:DNA polymerase III subunit chi [Spongiibacter sp. KMU-158]|uniref:DNA polymerase III subunit chi n=1 Tax=Spongiibacter pelagi TaxID=2760804 RepID=A0A927GV98_9GAMM|nr:DNA polymerase III subunit chi [Spongiibacter pelagi]MBD2858170.1 DNA polymerase III subunit chi [Spongiibacter pelagi]